YQHATSERDQEIAAAMDRRITGQTGPKPSRKRASRKPASDRDDGQARAG
ncbi:MAG: hypothetical protein QOE03_378, partial [Micromonosporaceae bacterium]|nr:hypothetical protein [Micromonosporaceae bacterium]